MRHKSGEPASIGDFDPIHVARSGNGEDRFLVYLGAYGWTRVLVYCDGLEEVDDVAIGWCAKNAPGLLADEAVQEAYKEALADALAEGLSEEDAEERAQEEAIVDTTSNADGDHWLNAWEISISENPTREEIFAAQKRTLLRATGKDPLASREPGNVVRRFAKK